MPKIDPKTAPQASGTRYPEQFAGPCKQRAWARLGDAVGLTQFGVNLMTLEPGVWTSQRHWHTHEDEFVWVLEGEVVMVTDAGEETLVAGECAGFKGGVKDGHTFQNRSSAPVKLLVVGSRIDEDSGEYPDIDLAFMPGRYSGKGGFRKKDGTPY
jgi:uncharacterized cupin superfamily protein